MNAKDYLNQCRDLSNLISAKQEEYRRALDIATGTQVSLKEDVVQVSKSNSREDLYIKCIELSGEIEDELLKLIDLQKGARELISLLNDNRFETILTYRYILNKGWNDIERLTSYEKSYLHRLHGDALEKANAILATKNNRKPL